MTKKKYPTIFLATAYLLFFMLFTFGIIVAKNFLYPIALGILFAYLLYPIENFFETKLKIPRILSNILSIIVGIIVLAGGFFIIYKQLEVMISDFPTLKAKALGNVEMLESFIESHFGIEQSNQKLWLKETVARLIDSGTLMYGKAFTQTTGTVVRIALLPVFVFFLLYYRDKFRVFILKITQKRNQKVVRNILIEVSQITQNYMGGVFIVVLILCVLNSFGLWVIGLEFPIMLGIIAAVCNFIPYFGTVLGFMFPLVFALLTQNSPGVILGVIILFIIIQFIENNILTPNIVGGNVRLNPFVIILSLIVGAMIWGIPGMLVIVPLMAVLRIICENIQKLQPYAFLLGTGGTQKHALTLEKIKHFLKLGKK